MSLNKQKVSRQGSCLALAIAFLFGSIALGGEITTPRVAVFRCEVTPPLGQPIYPSYKPLAEIEHPLFAKGILIEDGNYRYVLCAVDYCELRNSTHTLFRRKIAEAVGTKIAHVAVQSVHQHTAPMADGDAYALADQVVPPFPHLELQFLEKAADQLATAASEATNELQPFDQIGIGQAKVDRVASTRRVRKEDGSIWIRWSSCTDPALRAMPEGRIDPYLKTITFALGDKPLVRLHYYATHPQSVYGDPRASYDVPGIARERLEEKEKVPQIYFTGCAGDVTMGKYNDKTRRARAELANRLQTGMEDAIAATRWVPASPMIWRTHSLLMPRRNKDGFAISVLQKQFETNTMTREGVMRLTYATRDKKPIEISSLQIGNVRILHLPGEPMVEFQLYAQQAMPEAFVAVAGYGDGGCGYLCTEKAFQEGGYEPTASYVRPESEAILKQGIRHLLGVE